MLLIAFYHGSHHTDLNYTFLCLRTIFANLVFELSKDLLTTELINKKGEILIQSPMNETLDSSALDSGLFSKPSNIRMVTFICLIKFINCSSHHPKRHWGGIYLALGLNIPPHHTMLTPKSAQEAGCYLPPLGKTRHTPRSRGLQLPSFPSRPTGLKTPGQVSFRTNLKRLDFNSHQPDPRAPTARNSRTGSLGSNSRCVMPKVWRGAGGPLCALAERRAGEAGMGRGDPLLGSPKTSTICPQRQ